MNIKQKIFLISGLILIIIILLFWGIVKPLVSEIKTTSSLVQQRNEELFALEKTDQNYLKQLESDYKIIEEDISLIKSGFLDINKAVGFFIELENIASATSNNLEIKTEEFPAFTLNLSGDFPNLMKFLGWLENGDYLIDIDSIQIRRFTIKELEKLLSGNIRTNLKIRAFPKI